MAAVSEPVPIATRMASSSSASNLNGTPTAIEPATPILNGHNMAVLESIPKHKGESEFRTLFDLPNATLLDAFSAALQLKSLLLHGRLYISSSAICFYSGVFGRKTSKVIRYDQMIGLYKKNTAKVFPNAIEIVTLQHRYFFSSFMFRDACFKLAAQAWTDYLEASPSIETHRINTNSKMDLELFVRKPAGDEQVKMIEELEDDSTESSLGSSPPTETTLGSKKLGDSAGKSNAGASSTPSGSMSNLPENWDKSDDSHADEVDKKKNKRKSIVSSKKKSETTAPSSKELDDSDNQASSPTQHRHSVSKDSKGSKEDMKTRNVGFDLRMPAGEVSSEKLQDADVPSSAAETLSGQGSQKGGDASQSGQGEKSGQGDKSGAGSPPPDGNSGEGGNSSAGNGGGSGGGGGGSLPEIPVKIPTQASCKHIIEEAEDKKFSGTKLGAKTFRGVTLQQFFALVFCNPDYNKDLVSHFDYQDWNAPEWVMAEGNCCVSRMVTYKMHLNASLGPKSTRVDSHQNARFKNEKTLLIETANISKDVPMGDAFEVHEKWVITQEGKDVSVDISAGVIWKKSAWGLKGTINQKSLEGVTDNWEYVQKAIEKTVNKYTSGGGGGGGGGSGAASPSASGAQSPSQARAKKDDDESSSDDEDKKPRRKRRSTRKGSKEAIGGTDAPPEAGTSPGEFFSSWRGIASIAALILLVATLGFFAISVTNISYRLQFMESNKHWAPNGHEDHNLRERIAFLEHLTTALLHNVSDPGSYKSDQQRYFSALREMDTFLGKARESVGILQSSVHRLHQQRNEPLTTEQLVEALKTLPIDRKVLGYLINPDSFAQQLASVLEFDPATVPTHGSATATAEAYGGYFYFFIAFLLIAVAAAGGAKALGVF